MKTGVKVTVASLSEDTGSGAARMPRTGGLVLSRPGRDYLWNPGEGAAELAAGEAR